MNRRPYLSNSQRRALLFLEWVILIGAIGYSVYRWQVPTEKAVPQKPISEKFQEQKTYTYSVEEEPVETFAFDPNTADSTTLLRLGLAPWQVRAVYRYRAKHGRYHTPEDFMRLPGMTNELWERLGPHVRIAEAYRYVEPPARTGNVRPREADVPTRKDTAVMAEKRDTLPRQEKLAAGITVDLNTADTTLLKMIPGIGSRRAASIVAYRRQLGGFISAEQAMEAIEMPDTVLKWMRVEPQTISRINLNKASVQRMMNHPYLSFYQAKAINEHRRNKGPLQTLDDLRGMKEFRPTDLERLEPYVEFEE